LNVNPAMAVDYPSLAFSGNTPYAAWIENNGSGAYNVFVKFWNGSGWELKGGGLNVDLNQSAFFPSIAVTGTTPYVAWAESGQIYVRHWDGGNWVSDGAV